MSAANPSIAQADSGHAPRGVRRHTRSVPAALTSLECTMLEKIEKLLAELNQCGIRWCHWKSNASLGESLSGRTDVDLLVHRSDAEHFRALLSQARFKPAVTLDGEAFPSVEHYYALDEQTGILAHVHAYFRVITGESLAKNYRFPIEELLLEQTREIHSVRVPAKGAELVVFTLRMMLKHTSLMELFLLARYWKQVPQEVQWLLDNESVEEALRFVRCWLPSLEPQLFSECLEALTAPKSLLRRIVLGRRVRSQLRLYARHSALRAWAGAARKFVLMAFRRVTRSHKGMAPSSGGAVIAFVGSEATGKSTLIAEMREWLGQHFAVKQIHAGKPKSTMSSILPNLLVPLLRAMLPSCRSTRVENRLISKEPASQSPQGFPLVFAIRSALLAHDRRSLLAGVYGQAANGAIVLCDRYPSLVSGAPDSPQLSDLPLPSGRFSLRRLLARIETRLYRQIPPPDLVIYLSAPLEVTIARNATRGKVEPEDYVRQRHARSCHLDFGHTPVHKINTDQPFDRTVREVKQAIWNAL